LAVSSPDARPLMLSRPAPSRPAADDAADRELTNGSLRFQAPTVHSSFCILLYSALFITSAGCHRKEE
jgi:hypothetical protein